MAPHSCLGENVDCYCVAPITLGANSVVSQQSFLCTATHDYSHVGPYMPTVAAPISIGKDAWVAARAFIGPGVTVGEGAVVGACAVVVDDVDAFQIVAGNPARLLKYRRPVQAGELPSPAPMGTTELDPASRDRTQ
jgi:putative colanic acid biosynthesis acetyltransferase WcaF